MALAREEARQGTRWGVWHYLAALAFALALIPVTAVSWWLYTMDAGMRSVLFDTAENLVTFVLSVAMSSPF